ncbi:hypothetical protein CWO08_21875 [Vibrio sp. 10N.286.48.B8]|uniref:hypothetical protein n=1 Tax=Vibrio sp. 10N.286.48.B8 TaxID=2056189 RepID=UPI000D33B7EB|nr:hypothetical protein [Vibrio sp. 10N.286.48.B8]PTO90755.1 hypothetical protein CWO08_21875 [Vibrio sp. 10N.286.48.B8]
MYVRDTQFGFLVPVDKLNEPGTDITNNRNTEEKWQKAELSKVNQVLTEHAIAVEINKNIEDKYSELRTPTLSENDYFSLLGDRKLLVEYVLQEDFPDCDRPHLIGLAK